MLYGELWVNYNDVISSDLDIGLSEYPTLEIPNRTYTEVSIANHRGAPIDYDNALPNIKIKCKFYQVAEEHYFATYRKLMRWLKPNKGTLSLSEHSEYYYEVLAIEYGDLEHEYKLFGTMTVTFICYPFEFAHDGKWPIEIATNGNTTRIYNVYDESYPEYRIRGKGEFKLRVNENVFTGEVDGELVLNTRIKEAYEEVRSTLRYSKKIYISGNYERIWLKEGRNEIEIEGATGSIIPHWGYEL